MWFLGIWVENSENFPEFLSQALVLDCFMWHTISCLLSQISWSQKSPRHLPGKGRNSHTCWVKNIFIEFWHTIPALFCLPLSPLLSWLSLVLCRALRVAILQWRRERSWEGLPCWVRKDQFPHCLFPINLNLVEWWFLFLGLRSSFLFKCSTLRWSPPNFLFNSTPQIFTGNVAWFSVRSRCESESVSSFSLKNLQGGRHVQNGQMLSQRSCWTHWRRLSWGFAHTPAKASQEGSVSPLSDFQIPTSLILGLNQHFPQYVPCNTTPKRCSVKNDFMIN